MNNRHNMYARMVTNETLERIKRWPSLMFRFPRVRIYSKEHNAYWRGTGQGYTDLKENSDVWNIEAAFKRTKGCGPEKKICFVEAKECDNCFQLKFDIEFLLNRAGSAGSISFNNDRDTGVSSNSIVSIAYGTQELSQQDLPSDQSDLLACKRMWEKLPSHRKTAKSREAFRKAQEFIAEKYC